MLLFMWDRQWYNMFPMLGVSRQSSSACPSAEDVCFGSGSLDVLGSHHCTSIL